MMNWNIKTFTVLDELAHGAAYITVHVCTKIKEAVFSKEKNDHIYLTRMPM